MRREKIRTDCTVFPISANFESAFGRNRGPFGNRRISAASVLIRGYGRSCRRSVRRRRGDSGSSAGSKPASPNRQGVPYDSGTSVRSVIRITVGSAGGGVEPTAVRRFRGRLRTYERFLRSGGVAAAGVYEIRQVEVSVRCRTASHESSLGRGVIRVSAHVVVERERFGLGYRRRARHRGSVIRSETVPVEISVRSRDVDGRSGSRGTQVGNGISDGGAAARGSTNAVHRSSAGSVSPSVSRRTEAGFDE